MKSGSQPGVPSLTLAPLPLAETTLRIVNPQFLQTVSDHLGNHLTADDGFDDLLNDPLSTIDSDSDSLDSLGDVTVDVASAPGSFTPDVLSGIAQDLATFNASGDTITTTFGLTALPPSEPPTDTSGFKNTGDDGSGSPPPPPPPGQNGNPDLGGVAPPHDDRL